MNVRITVESISLRSHFISFNLEELPPWLSCSVATRSWGRLLTGRGMLERRRNCLDVTLMTSICLKKASQDTILIIKRHIHCYDKCQFIQMWFSRLNKIKVLPTCVAIMGKLVLKDNLSDCVLKFFPHESYNYLLKVLPLLKINLCCTVSLLSKGC